MRGMGIIRKYILLPGSALLTVAGIIGLINLHSDIRQWGVLFRWIAENMPNTNIGIGVFLYPILIIIGIVLFFVSEPGVKILNRFSKKRQTHQNSQPPQNTFKVRSIIDATHDFFREKIAHAEQLRIHGLNDTGFLYEAHVEAWKREVTDAIAEAFGSLRRDAFLKIVPEKRLTPGISIGLLTDRDYIRVTLENGIIAINDLIRNTFTEDLVPGFIASSLDKYLGDHSWVPILK